MTEDDLKNSFDTVLARFQNIGAVIAADWAVIEARLTAPLGNPGSDGSVTLSADTVNDMQSGIAAFGNLADQFQNMANGMVPPATVMAPVSGTSSTASVTDGAHAAASASVNGDTSAQMPGAGATGATGDDGDGDGGYTGTTGGTGGTGATGP